MTLQPNTQISIQPNYTALPKLKQHLLATGFALLSREDVLTWIDAQAGDLTLLSNAWHHLAKDGYLKDGGNYRTRRHSCFVYESESLKQTSHRAHWQPLTYNALHGGIERWFEPILPSTLDQSAFNQLLLAFARLADDLNAALGQNSPQYLEVHQFRIDTQGGIGRPTPEGAHRDGVDWVAVFMIKRCAIKGGETRVFDAFGTQGERFTLEDEWSVLLLNDARVIHESTPIQPLDALKQDGYRDTLVLTSKRGGFQAQ